MNQLPHCIPLQGSTIWSILLVDLCFWKKNGLFALMGILCLTNLVSLQAEKAVLHVECLSNNISIQQEEIPLEVTDFSKYTLPIKLKIGEEEHTLLLKVKLPELTPLPAKEIAPLEPTKIPLINTSQAILSEAILNNSNRTSKLSTIEFWQNFLSIFLLLFGCFYLIKQRKTENSKVSLKYPSAQPISSQAVFLKDKDPEVMSKPEFSIEDINWLVNLQRTVEQNMANIHFDVNQLANDLAISSRHLNRKIQQYVGLSTNKYIQEIRLTTARTFLEAHAYNSVKAVAYEVGFKDVKYFGQLYKKRFGRLPSTYFRKS